MFHNALDDCKKGFCIPELSVMSLLSSNSRTVNVADLSLGEYMVSRCESI